MGTGAVTFDAAFVDLNFRPLCAGVARTGQPIKSLRITISEMGTLYNWLPRGPAYLVFVETEGWEHNGKLVKGGSFIGGYNVLKNCYPVFAGATNTTDQSGKP